MKTIFVDMDGVLCDFNRKYAEHFEVTPAEMRRSRDHKEVSASWKAFVDRRLFTELDYMPGAERLIEFLNGLKGVRVSILSSSGGFERYRDVQSQKIEWLESHGIKWPPVIVPGRRYKAGFANAWSAIIDDTPDVIDSFKSNGGLAILYTPVQLDYTIKTLDEWLIKP